MRHLDATPEGPEPFYVSSGYEPKPQPVGEDEGIVVYQYLPTCAVNFVSDFVVGSMFIETGRFIFVS